MARPTTARSFPTSQPSYLLVCEIDEHHGEFVAVVTAFPESGCPRGATPECERRAVGSRAEAFRACSEMGFSMEARLMRRGACVYGWPPRRASA